MEVAEVVPDAGDGRGLGGLGGSEDVGLGMDLAVDERDVGGVEGAEGV